VPAAKVLTSTAGNANYEGHDLYAGNGDGYVCVKFLPGNDQGRSPVTRSILDNMFPL
jgi:hypothetical protein